MASYPMTQLGGRALNHSSSNAEAEYDRLRDLARAEHSKQQSLSASSQEAYQRGDGGSAHDLSQEAKKHAALKDQYNKQASEYIFRENNAPGRVAEDTIDLHGQFVEEAEEILEQRIRYARETGQSHLHVIVGKGNHSQGHIQKIKPRVEQVCRELGLQYHTEENAGRIYINLRGGPADPSQGGYQQGGYQQPHGGYHQQPQQQEAYPIGGYPGQQQHGYQQHQNQNQNQNDDVEQLVTKFLPRLLKSLKCCTVM